jgi:hypothetical protein
MISPRIRLDRSGNVATSAALVLFFIIGFVVMGILNTYIPRETQDIRSSAQTLAPVQDAKCINAGGECQTGKFDQIGKPCSLTDGTEGRVVYNYCPSQENDVRCCVPNAAPTAQADSTADYSAGLTVKLQGIGPSSSILNNTRSATIKIFKNSGTFDSADYVANDILTYDSAGGNFVNNNFSLGRLAAGEYQMVIQIPKYLDEQLRPATGGEVFNLSGGSKVGVAAFTMRAGDISPLPKGDNSVNIIDYNALIGCMPGAPVGACLNRDFADLNDDGVVDQKDLDILMENFNQKGFAFKTDQFKCEQDPSCDSGRDSLQLCSLLCTRVSKRS